MAAEDWVSDFLDYNDEAFEVEVECKFCGKGGLFWEEDAPDKWVLVDATGEIHKCDRGRVNRIVAEDFDDLS